MDPIALPKCVVGPKGSWALRVDDFIELPDEFAAWDLADGGREVPTKVGFAVVLVHRDASGNETTHALPHAEKWGGIDGGRALDVSLARLSGPGNSLYLTLLHAEDINGDGDPELLVEGSAVDHEGSEESWTELFTYRSGAIVSYAPAKNIKVMDIGDVDGDGRADLLTPGPYKDVRMQHRIGGWEPSIHGFTLRTLLLNVRSRDRVGQRERSIAERVRDEDSTTSSGSTS
jgi:hypothetical protein